MYSCTPTARYPTNTFHNDLKRLKYLRFNKATNCSGKRIREKATTHKFRQKQISNIFLGIFIVLKSLNSHSSVSVSCLYSFGPGMLLSILFSHIKLS